MDSSSSGSISSNGGGGAAANEEEYTSPRNEFISSFLALSNPNLDQYPYSNFLDPFTPSLNPNHDETTTPSSPWSSMPLFPTDADKNDNPQTLFPRISSVPNPSVPTNNGPQRVPKKRTRASRRPLTTVLTTDTSNFRNMVQEFTGFPAPPFVAASPFVRPRFGTGLGLFQTGTANPALGSPYLLTPFPQKMQNNPYPVMDAIASIARSSANLSSVNNLFGGPSSTSTSSSSSNTHFVNASTAIGTTTSSVDPISNLGNLQSNQLANAQYNFSAQGDLSGFVGSDMIRLDRDSVEPDKARSTYSESEMHAMDKGLFGFLNNADPKERR